MGRGRRGSATPPRRLTLTPVVLNCGLNTFFLVAGKDKREILAALRGENEPKTSQYPAARLQPAGPVVWFLDSWLLPDRRGETTAASRLQTIDLSCPAVTLGKRPPVFSYH